MLCNLYVPAIYPAIQNNIYSLYFSHIFKSEHTDRQTHPQICKPLSNGVHSSEHFQVKTYRQTDTSSNLYTSFKWCAHYLLPQYLQPSKITHTLSISATFGGIFGLCMGGSVMSLFEIFYHLLLVMIAMIKTLLNRHTQQPRDNVVLPSNIKTFTPHNKELLFHRMGHENIWKHMLNIFRAVLIWQKQSKNRKGT